MLTAATLGAIAINPTTTLLPNFCSLKELPQLDDMTLHDALDPGCQIQLWTHPVSPECAYDILGNVICDKIWYIFITLFNKRGLLLLQFGECPSSYPFLFFFFNMFLKTKHFISSQWNIFLT